MERNKQVIIIGGGYSIKEGIELGLWDKIKGRTIWSLNSAFKFMPYLPTRQLWVDPAFFKHEMIELQKLKKQGVELVARYRDNLLPLKKDITIYKTTRETSKYVGKNAIKDNLMFIGEQGFVGVFALSVVVAEGYNDIILLGYDYGSPSYGNTNTHFYQDKLKQYNIRSSGAGQKHVYYELNGHLKTSVEDCDVYKKEKDIKIWNVSTISNLYQFEKIDYKKLFEEVLDKEDKNGGANV